MKQNKYDDSSFFAKYSQMPRSIGGLEAAGEWSTFRAMLPDLRGVRVLDLGCGFGWHCRYAREQQASSVLGIELSANMLERAKEMTNDQQIEYRQMAIEDIDLPGATFDVILSSLALHYVEDYDAICRSAYDMLVPGGSFVFSVEHPIFTALAAQDWHYGPQGEKLHWPVDNYHAEGAREASFLNDDVIKYHRTVATYINGLLAAGFSLTKQSELRPTKEMLESNAAWHEEVRRPMFLLIAAVKI
ncbi:bifunctional 2-polyprenyl-6-hydroxyphenol methylase/3-demethylubiquinol 3-O-methyltransferase UbiG [Paenibacillus sp. OV219]|uniref:class I SAM-dependent methyltransferase n=1 Tax=Paenibacillus sp. OV219 TaxID=1884377 RepID=UPI0008B5AE41|nr:class I SAM-dependent methyltransferase [Paenibacillus sp. OV219]SEO01703.1 Methyltransferase domain-containing protein [Paenibacillus sp. OV219]